MSTPTTTPNQDTKQVNAIALKALLLDTVFHLKHGHHIHRNQLISKRTVCSILGISSRISSEKFLSVLHEIYKDNGREADFLNTVGKYGIKL